jgi:hypothetical protein
MLITFFENPAVYGKYGKYIVEPCRPQFTIWRMRIACWITKATNILSEYVIFNTFPRQKCLRERASMFSYSTYSALLLNAIISLIALTGFFLCDMELSVLTASWGLEFKVMFYEIHIGPNFQILSFAVHVKANRRTYLFITPPLGYLTRGA